MPTLIDSLIVALGLDSSQFEKEATRLDTADRKARDAALKRGRELEASQKKQREGFSALTKGVLAYTAAFLGIGSVTGFVKGIIDGDASVGRLSRRIGESTEEISAWQGVLRGAGGTAEDAANDLSLLRNAYEDIRLTGQSQLIPFLNLLGLSLKDLDDPSEALLKIADKFAAMDPTQAAAIGRQMGFSPAMISTLQKGRAATEDVLNAQYRLGVTSADSAAKAEELQRATADLITLLGGFARMVNEYVVPAATAIGQTLQTIAQDKAFRTYLAGAKDACLGLFNLAKPVFEVLGGLIQGVARLLSGDFAGAWRTARNTVANVVKDIEASLRAGIRVAERFWQAVRGESATTGAPNAGNGTPQTPGASPQGAGGSERFGHVVKFWTDRGYSLTAARGIAAGIWAESQGDPKAFNSTGGGKGAYGIGQWRGARQRELFRRYGANPTLMQQLEYMAWELNGGNGENGAAIRGARTETGALSAYVHGFMRPGAAGAAGDMTRGQAALQRYRQPASNPGSTTVTIGKVEVNTTATDARGIAQGISRELAAAVPQANVGLT